MKRCRLCVRVVIILRIFKILFQWKCSIHCWSGNFCLKMKSLFLLFCFVKSWISESYPSESVARGRSCFSWNVRFSCAKNSLSRGCCFLRHLIECGVCFWNCAPSAAITGHSAAKIKTANRVLRCLAESCWTMWVQVVWIEDTRSLTFISKVSEKIGWTSQMIRAGELHW